MECSAPIQEWTIETETENAPISTKAILVFSLCVENGIINGEVSDLTTGVPVKLSPVTGRSLALPELGLEDTSTVMTLIFTWGTTNVVLAGITFRKDVTNNFIGRFAAFKIAGGNADGPGDGDTGTGTGTQT